MIKINRDIAIGTLITLSGSALYVLMSVLSKVVGKHLLINHIMLLQSIAGLICASYFMHLKKYTWQKLFGCHRSVYLTRIAMSLTSIYALVYGLQYVSVFNALVILNAAPLIIPFLRKVFFRKQLNGVILFFILLAFTGVVLILGPDHHIIELPVIIIFISMICLSFSLLILEKMRDADPNLAIFYYFFYSTLVTSLLCIFQPLSFNLSLQDALAGLLIGILFFCVQVSVVYSARYISSQLMSVLFYVEILLSLLASMLLENMHLNAYIMTGIALVIAGGFAVVFIENKPQSIRS